MALEEIGIAGGSGLVGIILGYFGVSRRVDKIEIDMKQKIEKDTCEVCQKNHDDRLDRIEDKIDRLLERGV